MQFARNTRSLRSALVMLYVAALFGCDGPDRQDTLAAVVGSDSLSFEGEFRLREGLGEWMRCTDGKRFRAIGAGADSLLVLYTAQVGHVGDAAKVWLVGGWSADSTLVVRKLVHMAPALRCEPVPNAPNSGGFGLVFGAPGSEERRVQLDLFPSGLAVQYSSYRDETEREEFGSWGLNSDGVLQLSWPQRPLVLTFRVLGDSLVQHNARNADAIATFVRTGAPDPARGTLGETRRLLSEVAVRQHPTYDAATLGTPLSELAVNDSGMVRLGDLVSERYGMNAELRERRWAHVSTLQDLLELVRMQKR